MIGGGRTVELGGKNLDQDQDQEIETLSYIMFNTEQDLEAEPDHLEDDRRQGQDQGQSQDDESQGQDQGMSMLSWHRVIREAEEVGLDHVTDTGVILEADLKRSILRGVSQDHDQEKGRAHIRDQRW